MKKQGIINASISSVIAQLGHTDMITIADAGLPIPPGVQRIDISLKQGVPGFIETLDVVLTEMHIEKAYVSEDIMQHSPEVYSEIHKRLGNITIESIPHQEFKEKTRSTKAIIRTGEFTPFANVILVSGAWGFKL